MLLAPATAVAGIELADFGEEAAVAGLQRVHTSRVLPPPPSACTPASLPCHPHPAQVFFDARRQRLHLRRQHRQRHGVAFGQLAHAVGEGLRYALDLGLQRGALLIGLGVGPDRLQPVLDALGGELAALVAGLGEEAVLAALFFLRLLDLARQGLALGLERLDRGLLGSEEGRDQQRGRDEVGVGGAVEFVLPGGR